MNRKQTEQETSYEKRIRLVKQRKRKKVRLFFGVLLGVFFGGGILLTAVYALKMHSLQAGFHELTAKSEQVLVEAFPFAAQKEETAKEQVLTEKYSDILADEAGRKEMGIYTKTGKTPGEVTVTFAGDMMFDDSYSIMSAYKNSQNIEDCFSEDLLEKMQQSDIFMVNNECTFTTRGTPTPGKTYTFRGKPEYVKMLKEIGADLVSLANNHAYDYGEISLLDTLETLKNAEIPYVGAGADLTEAAKPVYYIVNDMKIAFLSATQIERVDNPDTKGATESSPGVFRCRQPEALCEAIRAAKAESDYVVVYVHWGTENETVTDWAQNEQAPLYAEAGADLIIGDHPHILQGIRYYNDTPVIFSLGNFWFNSKTIDTGMVQVTFTKEGIKSYQFIPCLQSGCRTVLLDGAEKQRVLQNMQSMSEGVSLDTEGFVWNTGKKD